MTHYYKYLGTDQDLLVESEEPRPDLLEWAYWAEIDSPAKPAAPAPEPSPEPEPAPETVETQPESEEQAADTHEPSASDEAKPAPAKKAPARKAPAKKVAE